MRHIAPHELLQRDRFRLTDAFANLFGSSGGQAVAEGAIVAEQSQQQMLGRDASGPNLAASDRAKKIVRRASAVYRSNISLLCSSGRGLV